MKTPKPWKAYGRYGTVGIELVASVILGYYAGRWLDGKFQTSWISWVGFLLGTYAGFRALFATAKHMQSDVDRDEREEREQALRERARLDEVRTREGRDG